MIPTSKEFIDTMRKRTVTTSARVDVIDNEYNKGIMIENGNYAIFEGNGIELDGSRCTISEENLNETEYMPLVYNGEEFVNEGWYSEDLSDENCEMDVTYETEVLHSKLSRIFRNKRFTHTFF